MAAPPGGQKAVEGPRCDERSSGDMEINGHYRSTERGRPRHASGFQPTHNSSVSRTPHDPRKGDQSAAMTATTTGTRPSLLDRGH